MKIQKPTNPTLTIDNPDQALDQVLDPRKRGKKFAPATDLYNLAWVFIYEDGLAVPQYVEQGVGSGRMVWQFFFKDRSLEKLRLIQIFRTRDLLPVSQRILDGKPSNLVPPVAEFVLKPGDYLSIFHEGMVTLGCSGQTHITQESTFHRAMIVGITRDGYNGAWTILQLDKANRIFFHLETFPSGKVEHLNRIVS